MWKLHQFFLIAILFNYSCNSVTGNDSFARMQHQADDSNLTVQQKSNTLFNATLLAYNEQIQKDSTFIEISEDLISFYYDALVTILNSTAGKNVDIIQNYRSFNFWSLYSLSAKPIQNAPFLEAWKDSTIETGIIEIDTLLSEKGFQINRVYYRESTGETSFSLETNIGRNINQITKKLEDTGQFIYIYPSGYAGDGGKIYAKRTTIKNKIEVLEINFAVGYGDCPSGCIYRDFYIFQVYTDGRVVFKEKITNATRF